MDRSVAGGRLDVTRFLVHHCRHTRRRSEDRDSRIVPAAIEETDGSHPAPVPRTCCGSGRRLARVRGDDGLGLLAAPAQAPFDLTGRVSGVRVVILGAGLAGMTVAYELGKVGYDCRVLEARARSAVASSPSVAAPSAKRTAPPDRRVRRGSVLQRGTDADLASSPHDAGVLPRAAGAEEVFVPDCESAYLSQTRGPLAGRRVRLREARADFDGYIAELLSKALSQTQLDQPLTAEDRDRLLAYLRNLGALDQQRQYRGSPRRGPGDKAPLALR